MTNLPYQRDDSPRDAERDHDDDTGISGDSATFLLALAAGMDWRHLHPEDRPEAARKYLAAQRATISDRSLERLTSAIDGRET